MSRALFLILVFASFHPSQAGESETVLNAISVDTNDWAWWRGPYHNGHAHPGQNPPLTWTETENVLWKTPIPGRGHSSATVVGNQVFLATAIDESEQQIVMCFDRRTGRQLWATIVHEGGFAVSGPKKPNSKASMASSTVACDGERLFINFRNDNAIWTTALSRQGEQLWQTRITDYVVHQGYGASPLLYQDLVISSGDNKGGGAVVAMNRANGHVVWTRERPAKPNYSSPVIYHVGGKPQLFLTGCDLVTSLDPLTGKEFWEIEGATTECVTTAVTDGIHVFTSGGYPDDHISAVRLDGTTQWRKNIRTYVPSIVQKDGHLYVTRDVGVALCVDCQTGEKVWEGRLGGTFSSSPVLVGNRIYATNEEGQTTVFNASPDSFEVLATNKLGADVFATPTICGGRIYTRVAQMQNGERNEYLYCLGIKAIAANP